MSKRSKNLEILNIVCLGIIVFLLFISHMSISKISDENEVLKARILDDSISNSSVDANRISFHTKDDSVVYIICSGSYGSSVYYEWYEGVYRRLANQICHNYGFKEITHSDKVLKEIDREFNKFANNANDDIICHSRSIINMGNEIDFCLFFEDKK